MGASEKGSTAVLTAMVMTAMVGVAGSSVVAVKRSLGVVGLQRNNTQAMYAAQAGLASAMNFLKTGYNPGDFWTEYVSVNNSAPVTPTEVAGNILPADAAIDGDHSGSPFADPNTYYTVTFFNNESDPGFALGEDQDQTLVVRAIGYGPGGSRVVLEVEAVGTGVGGSDFLCVGYAQQGLNELGSGRNDCMTAVTGGAPASFTPGGP